METPLTHYQWRFVQLMIGIVWIIIANTCLAQTQLFTATVPVASQSKQDLQQAAEQGLTEVLVRITGNDTITKDARLPIALKQAQQWVKRYRYEQQAPLQAWFEFDANSVKQWLDDSEYEYWTEARPTVGVWFGLDLLDQERGIVGADDADHNRLAERELSNSAQQFGFRTSWPDETASSAALMADVWALDLDALRANQPVPALLLIKATQTAKQRFEVHWGFDYDGKTQWQNQTVTDLASAYERIFASFNTLVTTAQLGQSVAPVELAVRRMDSLATLGQLFAVLDESAMVRSYRVKALVPDRVYVEIASTGGAIGLQKSLDRIPSLQAVVDNATAQALYSESSLQADDRLETGSAPMLKYRWVEL